MTIDKTALLHRSIMAEADQQITKPHEGRRRVGRSKVTTRMAPGLGSNPGANATRSVWAQCPRLAFHDAASRYSATGIGLTRYGPQIHVSSFDTWPAFDIAQRSQPSFLPGEDNVAATVRD